MKQQYFIGGFTWEGESQLDRFINEGIWVNGYEKDKYADLFKQVKVGDYFALKSTFVKNKQSWLKIARIGNVTKVLNEYTLQVKWLDIPVFEITDIRWYANTLEKISDNQHIEKIFGQAIKTNHMNKEIELLKVCKNLILTGAPGTGKTYKTAEIAVAICDDKIPNNRADLMKRYKELKMAKQITFTTFHQSLDYEEFVEGLKPDIDKNGNGTGTYSVQDGIFKEICKNTSTPIRFDDAKSIVTEQDISSAFNNLLDKIKINDCVSIRLKNGKWFEAKLSKNEKYITFGDNDIDNRISESSIIKLWKNFYTKEKFNSIQNIIGDIRPIIGGDSSKYWGVLNYLYGQIENNNPSPKALQNHIIIIDEINRGNISKIFGELITLLEKDKRLGEENEITVTLPYSQEIFGVPSNLFIIGTMNTADRSIGHIDYAIRRRFAFISMKADSKVIENYILYQNDTKQKAITLFNDVKQFIADNINADLDVEDLMIGHSYFLSKTAEDLKMRLEYEIIPLIEEYEKDGIIMVDKSELKEKFEEWKTLI